MHVNGAGFRFLTKTSVQKEAVEPNVKYNDGNWHHYVGVWTGSTMQLFRDNQLVSSITQTGSLSAFNQKLEFGRYAGNQDNNFFNGKIDEIGIWNRALTNEEITKLYIGCNKTITQQPANQGMFNGNATFTCSTNDTLVNYQWQTNSGTGWNNLFNAGQYSGANTNILIISNVTLTNNNQLFRCVIKGNCLTDTTKQVTLRVWGLGIEDEIVDELIVYPNPSSTQVIIDNGNYSTMGSYTAKIVNSIGQQVFQSVINQQQFIIDANTMGGAGVYTLYITDANNKVVGVKKIVLQ